MSEMARNQRVLPPYLRAFSCASYIVVSLLLISACYLPVVVAHDKQQYVRDIFGDHFEKDQHDNGMSRGFYSFTAKDINGNAVDLSRFAGKVSLVVNVASECGYTDGHYRSLVQLQQTVSNSKFNVLAFPCNQFGQQEPGENWQIQSFVEKIYKVNFPMFAKIDVLGTNVPESWKFLIETSGKTPTWNFWKYLVNENGVVLNAWGPQTSFTEVYKHVKEAIDKPRVNQHLHSDL